MSNSSPAHSSMSGERNGSGGAAGLSTDDFYHPSDLISIQDRKDEAMQVLKANLMAALNKEVKSLDEDNWMFEGPRSRINLISRQGGFLQKRLGISKNWNLAGPR
ncbi:protein SAMBA [Argentina anserina]|uniref:protein SAMBA n=1 Tax=Argentina anserina TaxID=57926 RepID=UPI0021768E0A|nr:protein SAMBA [Potentilla anserina]